MNEFTYFNPVKIHFDMSLEDALEYIKGLPYQRYLLVTSKGWVKRHIVKQIQTALGDRLSHIVENIPPNPELSFMQHIHKQQGNRFEAIIALGGGSVLDSAKFLSLSCEVSAHNGELCLQENKEGGELKPISHIAHLESKPIFCFPTTAGTSSELTKWATIWDKAANIKYSLMHEALYAKVAFYDQKLFSYMPTSIALASGLDTLSHALESMWNKNASPISIQHALKAIELIISSLPLSINAPYYTYARKCVMLASIYAGLAFSQTQTALAHAISYPITMRFNIPHGIACSFSLPILLRHITDKEINDTLKVFAQPIDTLFAKLNISSNPKDYGLDAYCVEEIFKTLNARAQNALLDIPAIKKEFLDYVR
ncbi:phosphonoacetaldehyde reductase [Helicobacter marmotae]|uniref:Alcohol dehydrogenase n=1 Tax=Helicobacter marmotae TaxID=152490 RepID=A0A3D8I6M6_9HELI|nr:phosphonoacetaldehyde reductase [Helicobacter marmotae]RDU60802.1 alcohol dehydrogenase [Helicobacter marmotae]